MSTESVKRAGRPKDPSTRRAILEAASELFLQGDFDRVTMDEIANRAGVSKLTVYSHFGEKDVLFAEAVRQFADTFLSPSMTDIAEGLPLEEALYRIASNYYQALMTSQAILGMRMAISHRVQLTPLPSLIWREGPVRVAHSMAQWLAQRPDLDPEDPAEAADLLMAMIRGQEHQAALFGQIPEQDPQRVEQRLRRVARRFARAFARQEV